MSPIEEMQNDQNQMLHELGQLYYKKVSYENQLNLVNDMIEEQLKQLDINQTMISKVMLSSSTKYLPLSMNDNQMMDHIKNNMSKMAEDFPDQKTDNIDQ